MLAIADFTVRSICVDSSIAIRRLFLMTAIRRLSNSRLLSRWRAYSALTRQQAPVSLAIGPMGPCVRVDALRCVHTTHRLCTSYHAQIGPYMSISPKVPLSMGDPGLRWATRGSMSPLLGRDTVCHRPSEASYTVIFVVFRLDAFQALTDSAYCSVITLDNVRWPIASARQRHYNQYICSSSSASATNDWSRFVRSRCRHRLWSCWGRHCAAAGRSGEWCRWRWPGWTAGAERRRRSTIDADPSPGECSSGIHGSRRRPAQDHSPGFLRVELATATLLYSYKHSTSSNIL